NFIVILVISIVVFGMGIYLMNKFFGAAQGKVLIWDDQMEQEIEQLLDDGSKVAIPFYHKKIGNKQFDSFGIGIFNIVDAAETNFKTTISFNALYQGQTKVCDSTGIPSSCVPNPNDWLRSTESDSGIITIEKTIKKFEQSKFLIGIDVINAEKGTYLFDVVVKYEKSPGIWDSYDDQTHRLIVDVS
ncbi:MAG: hypothetical protein ABIJ08_04530, partial [Nanoarchaeota archaeon]